MIRVQSSSAGWIVLLARLWCAALAFGTMMVSVGADEWIEVDSSEADSLLRYAATVNAANFEGVTTWTGEGEIVSSDIVTDDQPSREAKVPSKGREQSGSDIGPGPRRMTRKFQFWLDMAGDRLQSRLIPTEMLVQENSESVASDKYIYYGRRTIVLPSESLTFRPDQRPGRLDGDPQVVGWIPHESRVAYREDRDAGAKSRAFGDVFDPRFCLTRRGIPFHEELELYRGSVVKGSKGIVVSKRVTPSGTDLQIVHRNAKGEFRYVVGGSSAMSMREFEYFDDQKRLYEAMSVEYQSLKGKVLPSKMVRRLFDVNTGAVTTERAIEFESQAFNVPIDDSLFSMAGLELSEGDRLNDRLAGRLMVVGKGGKLISPREFDTERGGVLKPPLRGIRQTPVDQQPKSQWTRWLLVGVNVGILAIVAIWYYRKK